MSDKIMISYMIKYHDYVDLVQNRLKKSRFNHTLGVIKEGLKLAAIYGCDRDQTFIAALFHDYAKNMSDDELYDYLIQKGYELDPITKYSPQLFHGLVAADIVKTEFEIEDEDVINAIRYHTVGRIEMSILEKVIFIADATEMNRVYPGVEEIREKSYQSLDDAILLSLDQTINYILSKNLLIHPNSFHLRNAILLKTMMEDQ